MHQIQFSRHSLHAVLIGLLLLPFQMAVTGSPTATGLVLNATPVAAGARHSCALTTADTAYCWGRNEAGQLGTVTIDTCTGMDGTFPCSTSPIAVSGGIAFASLRTGALHSCGLTAAGKAYCWGLNDSGQLGSASNEMCDTITGPLPCTTTPAAVTGGLIFSSLSTGNIHTCGLTIDGNAFCWGENNAGELGDGTTERRSQPVAVTGGHTFISISAGTGFTCGVTTGSDGYCWGSNTLGQLGNGAMTNNPTPAPTLVAGGHSFESLSAGGEHSCGLTTSGAAYCWGDNDAGQVGNGSTTRNPEPMPAAVAGNVFFESVKAGGSHTCGITRSGVGFCWGANSVGALGTGTLNDCLGAGLDCEAEPTAIAGSLDFASVAPGEQHTCANTIGDIAYCWGWNDHGWLGDGSTTTRTTPVLVDSPLKYGNPFGRGLSPGDVNGNGAADFAVLLPAADGDVHLYVRDGGTGNAISNIPFGELAFIAMALVPDIDGSGKPEIAVVGIKPDGNVRAWVRDALSGVLIRQISYSMLYRPVAAAVVPDLPGGPAVAVVGVNDAGDVRTQVKDAKTGALVRLIPFATAFPPKFMVTIPDITGNNVSELGVLGIDAAGNVRVQVKDASTGSLKHWVQFARSFSPRQLLVIPGIDGGTIPGLAVLGMADDGRVRIQVKNAATRSGITFVHYSAAYPPFDAITIADLNNNNVPELAVLGINASGIVRAQIKDAVDRTLIKQVFFAKTFPPKAFIALGDANGNLTWELSVLGINPNNGNHRVQIKDALTGNQISSTFVP